MMLCEYVKNHVLHLYTMHKTLPDINNTGEVFVQQEKCLPGIFINPHTAAHTWVKELVSGLGRKLSTALSAALGCSSALFWLMVVSVLPGTERNSLGHTRAMTLPKMTIVFWPLKQRISSGLFYWTKWSFSASFPEAHVGPMFFITKDFSTDSEKSCFKLRIMKSAWHTHYY